MDWISFRCHMKIQSKKSADLFFSFSKGRYFCLITYYAEPTIHWPLDEKRWFIGKHTDAGKDWKQKENEVGDFCPLQRNIIFI